MSKSLEHVEECSTLEEDARGGAKTSPMKCWAKKMLFTCAPARPFVVGSSPTVPYPCHALHVVPPSVLQPLYRSISEH